MPASGDRLLVASRARRSTGLRSSSSGADKDFTGIGFFREDCWPLLSVDDASGSRGGLRFLLLSATAFCRVVPSGP